MDFAAFSREHSLIDNGKLCFRRVEEGAKRIFGSGFFQTVKESPQLEALNLQEVSRCKEVREIHEEVIRLLEHIDSLENQVLREQLLR